MIIHEMQQGSEEWFQIKLGKFGGGSAHLFLTDGNSAGGIGAGLRKAIVAKASEIITGESTKPEFSNEQTERGLALEPIARQWYENQYFETVREVGFVERSFAAGCSPDGLVGDRGGIEIKCPKNENFIAHLLGGDKVPRSYYAQIQWSLFITGREWWDYVVYNRMFTPTCQRIYRDEELIKSFESKLKFVESEMNRIMRIVAKREAA